MKWRVALLGLAAGVVVALPLLAQGNPTATVRGVVKDADGAALPGVTVTFSSAQLQGTRVVQTRENGAYVSPPLTPGEYEITFQLEGYQTVTHRTRLGANFEVPIDATLPLATVAEEIVVTGEAVETISESTTSATTVTRETLEDLPVTRTFNSAVALAPGVSTVGPGAGNAITISGGQSWENLFTLNGVVLNENIRGQAFDLFIEDAIQETATAQSGVSAEYGRFTGGVVTAITKSGGNSFEGSFRTSFDNQDWVARNEFSPEREDVRNETYEATVGGRVVRDRLWFFGAGRDREETDQATTTIFNIPYPTANDERRLEGKLTAGLTTKHQLQGSYIEIEEDQINVAHGGLTNFAVSADDGSIDPVRSLPQELFVVNYTGIITDSFFVEAQYGERQFTFEGTGGSDQSIPTGTPTFDLINSTVYNDSLFCDSTAIPQCIPEERDNEQGRAKGSYFLTTENAGSHDIGFGYETFSDIRATDNHQSANDLMIWNFVGSEYDTATNTIETPLIPGATLLFHLPILNPTQGTDFSTDSYFVNDRWRLNDHWSFNLGLRYDQNDSVNSLGLKVADSDSWSPRLGATWDIGANGKNVLHATAGRYVGAQANGVFDSSSSAGNPAAFGYLYLGPDVGNFDPVTATQIAFDWLFGVCPTAIDQSNTFGPGDPFSCPFLAFLDIPGATTILDTGLSSTSSDEFTLGYQRDLGAIGNIRFDYVHREFGDFFLTRRDLTTGQGTSPAGDPFDLGVIVNDEDLLRREYDGVSAAWNLRFVENKLRVGGNVTWSKSRGNFDGETSGSGPITSGLGEYPEYKERRWNAPEGDLAIDQRIRGRVWGIYDIFSTERHHFNVSLLQSYFSGAPYQAVASIGTQAFVANPGYITPPTTVQYFFSQRGAFTTDDITRTDLSLNYGLNFGKFEIFIQPEVLNIFNEDATVDGGENATTTVLAPFDPFTETPVEGVHWEKGPNFGKALEEDDLQAPREFRFSVGFRWNP